MPWSLRFFLVLVMNEGMNLTNFKKETIATFEGLENGVGNMEDTMPKYHR